MKVLVVNDSKAMRVIVVRNLRNAGCAGASFTEAASGQQAIELAQTESFDLVLSSWTLPTMSGLELCRALNHEHPGLAFGILTSVNTPTGRALAIKAGAKFVIETPFTPGSFEDVMDSAWLQADSRGMAGRS